MPEALLQSEEENQDHLLASFDGAQMIWGRFFLRAELPLPLRREDTPIVLEVWIEVLEDAASGICAVLEGERRSFSGRAHLASDVPGFPGSSGSVCRIRFRGEAIKIIDCGDERISSLRADLDHEEMAALYRCIWGNSDDLAAVRWDLRQAVASDLQDRLGGRCQTKLVEPPSRIAGIDPGEVLVSPPLDTGRPAFLSTVGCSDVADSSGRHYEITTRLQNPSDDLVRCFGEFVYLARMNPHAILPGQIVPERKPIPDSNGKMSAWLLIETEEAPPWEATKADRGLVEYLQAFPLMPVEVSFASAFGVEKLQEVLHMSGEDLTSLKRLPSVEAIE